MDNKLSELSKPTALRNKHTGRTFNATENTEPQIYESLYSQEYVSALLAELEAKDKRIAELEEQKAMWVSVAKELGSKCDALEAKLATPVRFPDCDSRLYQSWLTGSAMKKLTRGSKASSLPNSRFAPPGSRSRGMSSHGTRNYRWHSHGNLSHWFLCRVFLLSKKW